MTVVGILIGSGIFALPSEVFRAAQAPGLGLLAWAAGGIITIAAGISAAELSAAMPKVGGSYVYLNAAYGQWCGFLQGWAAFLAGYSGINAALSIVFVTYLNELVPVPPTLRKPAALIVMLALTAFNYRGVKLGGVVQSIFTIGKLIPIAILTAAGFAASGRGHYSPLIPSDVHLISAAAGAILATLWAYDGWLNVAMLSEEIKNPNRNLPLALILGISIATLIYTLLNSAMLKVLTTGEIAGASAKPAALMASRLFGTIGYKLIIAGILISVFGALNGFVMTTPRYFYAMARDGLFICSNSISQIHPRFGTPHIAIVSTTLWSAVLLMIGNFTDLINLVVFVSWTFYVMTIGSLFVLRIKQPELERPYKAFGYPVTPIVGIAGGLWVLIMALISNPRSSIIGLFVTVLGLPVYRYLKRKAI